MKRHLIIGGVVLLGIISIASAQLWWQPPLIVGTTQCLETDSGIDYVTPGQVSGLFYDLAAGPATAGFYSLKDSCGSGLGGQGGSQYLLRELVCGSNVPNPNPPPANFPGFAGIAFVDCRVLIPNGICVSNEYDLSNVALVSTPISGSGALLPQHASFCSPAGPDLRVQIVTVLIGGAPNPTFTIQIGNTGNQAVTSPTTATISFSGTTTTVSIPPLGPNSGTTISSSFFGVLAGTHTLIINLDTTTSVAELSELNNVVSIPVTIQ